MTGIELIAIERNEQIKKHGYDESFVEDCPQYYSVCQLALMAELALRVNTDNIAYIKNYPKNWPEEDVLKILRKPYKERLIIAGALIAAEIDRLQASRT